MSHSNVTPNLQLPQFVNSDIPAWLTDVNDAMDKIDAGYEQLRDTSSTSTQNIADLTQRVQTNENNISTLRGQVNQAITSEEAHTVEINNIKTEIGDNQLLVTTDKTLVGAINEVATGGSQAIQAVNVSYNNTTSGILASNVQGAIDVTNAKIPFRFGVDSNGNYGYIKAGADSVTPFKTTGIYYLGTGNTFDVKTKFPNEYTTLTPSNFIAKVLSVSATGGYEGNPGSGTTSGTINPTISYNASSGIVSVENTSGSWRQGGSTNAKVCSCSVSVAIYCVTGTIE